MDQELKNNIRLRWLTSLFEFAHHTFQKDLWINAAFKNIIGDYSEAICKYFDDLNLEDSYKEFIEQGFVTQNEADIVTEFHAQLLSYIQKTQCKKLKDQEILNDSEWINLTQLAKTNWEQLKTVILDRKELEYMTELESKYLLKT